MIQQKKRQGIIDTQSRFRKTTRKAWPPEECVPDAGEGPVPEKPGPSFEEAIRKLLKRVEELFSRAAKRKTLR